MNAPSPFGLAGDEYWTNPWKNIAAVAREKVMASEAALIADAPSAVTPNAQKSLPFLVLDVNDRVQMAQAAFKGAGIIAAQRLDTNELRAVKAFTRDSARSSADEVSPGFAARENSADLIRIGAVNTSSPGSYLLSAIVRDRVSNRVPMKVGQPAAAFNDAEVAKFLAAQRAKLPASTVRPEEGDSAIYGDAANCPPVPEKEGIALAAERVVVLDNDSKAFVNASFRLPLFVNDVVADPSKIPDGVKKRVATRGPCTGIVGISLLVVGADDSVPRVIRLDVPVFAKIEGTPERPLGVGHFKFDLFSNEQILLSPQTYFIYAFSHEFMAGPIACAIVPESALPKAR